MGIEPTYSAWKAEVLPLNYTRTNSANISHLQTYGGGGRITPGIPAFRPSGRRKNTTFKIASAILVEPLSAQTLPT